MHAGLREASLIYYKREKIETLAGRLDISRRPVCFCTLLILTPFFDYLTLILLRVWFFITKKT